MKTVARLGWLSCGLVLAGTLVAGAAARGGGKVTLTVPAREAIKAAFPRATVTSVSQSIEDGVSVLDVELVQDEQRLEVDVSAEGVIFEVEHKVALDDLPKAVRSAVVTATSDARITRIEKCETRAEAKEGKLVSLAKPHTAYHVRYTVGERASTLQVRVGEAGSLTVRKPGPGQEGNDEDDDDEDGDENENDD